MAPQQKIYQISSQDLYCNRNWPGKCYMYSDAKASFTLVEPDTLKIFDIKSLAIDNVHNISCYEEPVLLKLR